MTADALPLLKNRLRALAFKWAERAAILAPEDPEETDADDQSRGMAAGYWIAADELRQALEEQ